MLFKIKMDTRKDFFEICKQFGHARPKMFASSVLGENKRKYGETDLKINIICSMCVGYINLFNKIVQFRAFIKTAMKEMTFFHLKMQGKRGYMFRLEQTVMRPITRTLRIKITTAGRCDISDLSISILLHNVCQFVFTAFFSTSINCPG